MDEKAKEIIKAYLSGVMTDEEYDERMEELGFTKEQAVKELQAFVNNDPKFR